MSWWIPRMRYRPSLITRQNLHILSYLSTILLFILWMTLQVVCLTWNKLCFWKVFKTQMKGWSKGWNTFGWPQSFRLPHIVFWKNFILFESAEGTNMSRDILFPEGCCLQRWRNLKATTADVFILKKCVCVVIGCGIKVHSAEKVIRSIYRTSHCHSVWNPGGIKMMR